MNTPNEPNNQNLDDGLIKDTTAKPPYSDAEMNNLLSSVSPWKIAIPILLGLGLVVYLFIANFKAEEFSKMSFTSHTYTWIGMAALFVCIRHLCYMIRLRLITEGHFSWKKCFELIVIWEFSSCITPSSVGGSAVSMFVISQEEGMTAGRTVMTVLYTMVIDTFFFLTMLLVFFSIFGALMIFPGLNTLADAFSEGWATAFLAAYAFMFLYGSFLVYGVLVNPVAMKKFLVTVCRLPFLNRFQAKMESFGNDMITASSQLTGKSIGFHVGAILATAGAWMSRFMILNCLIIAFVTFSDIPEVKGHYDKLMTDTLHLNIVMQQVFIYAREQAMYVLMAVIPSPGAAGGAELAFLEFHKDYLPDQTSNYTLAIIIGSVWRMFTFYSYLIFGAVVVPRWVTSVIAKRKIQTDTPQ
jgi:glycosyltransferase 2 family protein